MQAVTNPVATISLEEMVQQLDSLERYENISVLLIIYWADTNIGHGFCAIMMN